MRKKAFFRFEASPEIGAGHAIRSTVIADELVDLGWDCKIITKALTYDFIPHLSKFGRIDPYQFNTNPQKSDLLVFDGYEYDAAYEGRFRAYTNKIMVIDDLANRPHECDILLDQTYGRDAKDYQSLVPNHCRILAGSDYALIRKEIRALRPQALEKRKAKQEIKRILVSLGGSDPKNFTLQALEMIKESGFKGAIDVVLGFASKNRESVETYLATMANDSTIHVNPNLPQLMLEADLAIGAAGSSVWERACLGLPQVLIQTADNQSLIFKNIELIVASMELLQPDNSFPDRVFTIQPKTSEILSYVV
ncbi:MAG: UDP-2,4-diacetamido-2,4,6-trideoxy-beta-L-altropyranose hydrolase [Gammaproteobacteria bacterium]